MESIMTVRIPDELQEELKKEAARHGLTRNAFVIQLFWDWKRERDRQNGERRR